MKKIYILLSVFLLACGNTPGVVIHKSKTDIVGFDEVSLPPGLCRFVVTGGRTDLSYTFIDSCHYYHAFDTVQSKSFLWKAKQTKEPK